MIHSPKKLSGRRPLGLPTVRGRGEADNGDLLPFWVSPKAKFHIGGPGKKSDHSLQLAGARTVGLVNGLLPVLDMDGGIEGNLLSLRNLRSLLLPSTHIDPRAGG